MRLNLNRINYGLKNRKIEITAFIVYAAALIVIMCFHEPWFDEAQAWLIARDASVFDLFSQVLHYEGHPPLWFLILMPFAKSGVPFEVGVKAVNFALVTTAMGIFMFRAPFPRFVRIILPFSYFFFYQYGVVSRNYSLMMLGFVLCALAYKKRNEKPFLFIGALLILCGASVYGMLFAAGIAAAWLIEIITGGFSFKDRRVLALAVLLIINVLIALFIYPLPGTYATATVHKPVGQMLFYMFFVLPADAVCLLIYSDGTKQLNSILLVAAVIISGSIHLILYREAMKVSKRALFLIPYCLFAVFSAFVYFWIHHIGVVAMFYLFLVWCIFDARKKEAVRCRPAVYYGKYVLLVLVLGVSVYWSAAASYHDIRENYGMGRETAEFIYENKLDNLKILAAWRKLEDGTYDYNSIEGIPAQPYFKRNIFLNAPQGKSYLTHKIDTSGEITREEIRQHKPEVLITCKKYTFGDLVDLDEYALVKTVSNNIFWKDKIYESLTLIYIRKDILERYPNLKPLENNLLTHTCFFRRGGIISA